MKKVLPFLFLLSFTMSCTAPDSATKALQRNGYKPIKVGGYAFFGGSESDFFKTKFIAVAHNGDTVHGVVTKGIFKGSTIRLND